MSGFFEILYSVFCVCCPQSWIGYHLNNYQTFDPFSVAADNGFNPVFEEICDFDVLNPELAFLRFVVQDEDMFGDPNFLGQATFPLQCIRTGRSIRRHPIFQASAY